MVETNDVTERSTAASARIAALSAGAFSILAIAALTSCASGSSNRELAPLLPGEGTAHTAKPRDPSPDDDEADDPWADKQLIAEPAPQPPKEVSLPPIERFKLRNGLEVMVVENHDLPVVGLQLAVKVGELDQPRDKVGLASFAAEMLTKGTRRKNAADIAETVEFAGGSLTASADTEATFVSCSVLAKDLNTCLSLLPDVVASPTFPESEMGPVRDALLASVRQRSDNAAAMASAHFVNLLWGEDHPRGWPLSSRSIQAIGRKDLVDWHKTWFTPQNAILAVAGDVDAKTIKKRLEMAFRGWRKGKQATRSLPPVPPLEGIHVRVVDKPDQTQSHIRVGHFGISRQDADYPDMLVMNYVLGGGGFASRLMTVVRSEGGKTYGAYSSFDSDLSRGAFVAQTFTRTAETAATLKLVVNELRKMADGGPREKEIADAKTAIAGNYATRFGSALAVANALLSAELRGFNDAYVRTFALRIAKVTTKSAGNAAKERLDPANLAIVVVGNASEIVPQLEDAGFAKPEVISYLDPIARYEREAPPIDPATEKQARALLDRALKAKGGAAKLRSLKSVELEGEAKLSQGGQTQDAKQRRLWLADGRLRLDVELPALGVEIAMVASAKGGWVRQAMGQRSQVVDLPTENIAGQLWRNGELLLMRHLEDGAQLGMMADETVEGTTYKVVYLAAPGGKFPTKLYLHPSTLMLERVSFSENGAETYESYSDYRRVQGIQIAHERNTVGVQTAKFKVAKVTINGPVKDELFTRPAN